MSKASDKLGVVSWSVVLTVCVFALLACLRIVGLHIYPEPAVDEGLWTLQAKDHVLFGDATMNGLRQALLSPVHFIVCVACFHVLPATLYSVRLLNAVAGLLTLWLLWVHLRSAVGVRRAFVAVVVAGCSFTLVMIHRRAYLEGGVLLLSWIAVMSASRTGKSAMAWLAVSTGILLAYKSNAAYLVPALLLPAHWDHRWRSETLVRGLAVSGGLLIAAAILAGAYWTDTEGFVAAYRFELMKGGEWDAVLRVGRFGLYPRLVASTLLSLLRSSTDLMLLTVIAAFGVCVLQLRRQDVTRRCWLWLLCGLLGLLTQGFQHAQYFAPLTLPATVVASCLVYEFGARSKAKGWVTAGLGLLFLLCNLARITVGTVVASKHSPCRDMAEFISVACVADEAYLGSAELAAATTRRAYAYHRIFRPYPMDSPPDLIEFVRSCRVSAVVDDEWEARSLGLESEFFAPLATLAEVDKRDGWTAYRIRDAR